MGIFKYLGRFLYRLDYDWPAVGHNIIKARQFWGRLGKILQREGGDHLVSTMFYRGVVQTVLLFGSETWVLLTVMAKNLENFCVVLLCQVVVKTARQQWGGTWRRAAS